jgi:4-hydroxy-tetrahydrodipicolinate reductase
MSTPTDMKITAMQESRTLRVGIFGRGRLGSMVARLVEESGDLSLAWTVGRDGPMPRGAVDVALDASVGGAVQGHLAWALASGTSIVVGATGWDRGILDAIEYEPKALPIGIMLAPNFSVAMAFMRRAALALGGLAALERQADLAIVERHHRAKADAPSGSATQLAEALAMGSGRHCGWALGSARDGAISIASLRSGTSVGYHELRYEAPRETIVFSHVAYSREVFAEGALRALRWLPGRTGLFSFDQLCADILAPIFQVAATWEVTL